MASESSLWDPASGLAVLPGLLSHADCVEVVAECHGLFADTESAHPSDRAFSGTRHLVELDRRLPAVGEMLRRPALSDLLAEVTGRVPGPPVQVSLRSPQPGFGGQDLHRDTVDSVQGDRPTAVTVIVALVDFTEDNGATRVVPGSHLSGRSAEHYRGRRSSPDEITLTGSAGTAFVFSGHVLHSGTENRSGEARPALQILWR